MTRPSAPRRNDANDPLSHFTAAITAASDASMGEESPRCPPPSPRLPTHCLIALSGGSDSVALALLADRWRAVHAPSTRLTLAHLDHRLRGTASRDDASWCTALAHRLGLPIVIESEDVSALASREKWSIELAAREARLRFFSRVARTVGAELVLTGHHRDDQIETVLHRIGRGSGPRGWAGMPRVRRLAAEGPIWIVRPCLALSRTDLRAVREHAGFLHREDRTNAMPIAERNRLRHELLPRLRAQCDEKIDTQLLRLAAAAQRVSENDRAVVEEVRSQIVATGAHRSVPPAVARALGRHPRRAAELGSLLRDGWPLSRAPTRSTEWRAPHHRAWSALLAGASHGSRLDLPARATAERSGGWVHLLREETEPPTVPHAPHAVDLGRRVTIPWAGGTITLEAANGGIPRGAIVRGALPRDRFRVSEHRHRVGELLRHAGVPERWRRAIPVLVARPAAGETARRTELLALPRAFLPRRPREIDTSLRAAAEITMVWEPLPGSILDHLHRVAHAARVPALAW